MDDRRAQLVNDIKLKLIQLNYIILDFYVNENCYSIDYEIITNKNTIVLSLKMFYENGDSLFDEISIYDYDGNNLLIEIPLNKNHTATEITELLLSHFKSPSM